jgi:hypothetical protein
VYTHSASGLGSRRLTRTGSASDGGWDHGDDDGQRSLHSDRLGARVICESKKLSHHCGYKREIMNRYPITSRQTPVTSLQVGHRLACLTLLLSLCARSIAQTQSEAQSPVPGSAIHVTHVLGFEGARHNATGGLRIQVTRFDFRGMEVQLRRCT